MSTGNFICYKVQAALKAYLQTKTYSSIPVAQIYAGIENTTSAENEDEEEVILLPSVVCVCQTAGVGTATTMSGSWEASAMVTVKGSAHDATASEFEAMAQAVFNDICTDSIATDLSSALADFTAFLVLPTSQSWNVTGESWEASMGFTIYCCGSDIS